MKQPFYKTHWWGETMTSLVGTVVGIVLTFGTTFYMEKKDKADMARKTVIITLHNLDSRITNLEQGMAWMNHVDTLFRVVSRHGAGDLQGVPADTLLAAFDIFTYQDIQLSENIAESIFANSIEVWEYMDDERIIGRISNCYAFSNFCAEVQQQLQEERTAIFKDYLKQLKVMEHTPEAARGFLSRPDVQFHLDMHSLRTGMLNNTLKIIVRMHERNKQELGIPQEELDAAGKLLTEEDYAALNGVLEEP